MASPTRTGSRAASAPPGWSGCSGACGAFIEAAQWQQYRALKYQIETMRRQPALAGYVITEFTDCHWESNGLLDMRRNPRVFHDAFAAINAETVVVPSWDRVAYWSGEPIRVELAAAHGGGERVPDVMLRWRCGAGGGRSRALPPGARRARPAARHVLGARPGEPRRSTARAGAGAAGRVLATNHLELTVLPRRADGRPPRMSRSGRAGELADRIQALGYRLSAFAARGGCRDCPGAGRKPLCRDPRRRARRCFWPTSPWSCSRSSRIGRRPGWSGEAGRCGKAIGSRPSRGCGAMGRSRVSPAGR